MSNTETKPTLQTDMYDMLDDVQALIIALVLPFLVKAGLVVVALAVIFQVSTNVVNEVTKAQRNNIINNAVKWGESLEQDFISLAGNSYGLPIKEGLTREQKVALMTIYIPEWGTRGLDHLGGDLDSVCPNQQRASELWTDPYLAERAKGVIGEQGYNSIFTEGRKTFVLANKDKQLRQTAYPLTSPYGQRPNPFGGGTSFHYGVDFGHPTGDEIYTAHSGVVSQVVYDTQGGGNVVVVTGEKYRTLYAHLDRQLVKKGDNVVAGQRIGISGNTGFSTGSHLHFQIMGLEGGWNSDTIDPSTEPYLTVTQSNPFYALALHIHSVHAKTGLCDELTLARLERNYSAKKWLDKKVTPLNMESFMIDMCNSQAPIDCTEWIDRARPAVEELITLETI